MPPAAPTSLSPMQYPRLSVLLVDRDPDRRSALREWLESAYEVHVAADVAQALALASEVIPSILVADVTACSVGPLVERVLEELSVFDIRVVLVMNADDPVPEAWADYIHLRRPFTREQMLECVARTATSRQAPAAALRRERQRREEAETLLGIALDLNSQPTLKKRLQRATDAATHLSGAAFGVLFCKSADGQGGKFLPYAVSGVPREKFDALDAPLFAPICASERIVRSDDVLREPPDGKSEPHRGMPKGLAVRSYLGVPVVSRSREVLGGLFFGHPEPAMFTQRSERLAAAIAMQIAVAIENDRRRSSGRGQDERGKQVDEKLHRSEPSS